jgi:hypothetical protein
VIVQRIGDVHHRSEGLSKPRLLLRAERRHLHAHGCGGIRDQRRLAPGAADGGDAPSGQRARDRQQLESLQELGKCLHARNAQAAEERVVMRVITHEGARMAERGFGPELRSPHLQRHQRHTRRVCRDGYRGEPLDVLDALDVDADGLDSGVRDQRLDIVGDREHRLVADGDQIAQR